MVKQIRSVPGKGDEQLPDGAMDANRWSHVAETGCGRHFFSRPCQREDCSAVPPSAYPHAAVCRAPREVVLVVDDDEGFRSNLIEMIEAIGLEAVGFESSAQLVAALPNYDAGCVLLDIRLPGEDGLAIQEWMNKTETTLPVIFISGVKDVSTVVHCMKAGALDFLQKPFAEMELRKAVVSAVGKSRVRYCELQSRALAQRLVEALTPAEEEVANLISRGYATKMIAAELGRSPNTIKIHRHRMFAKLKVHSSASVANIIRHLNGDPM